MGCKDCQVCGFQEESRGMCVRFGIEEKGYVMLGQVLGGSNGGDEAREFIDEGLGGIRR